MAKIRGQLVLLQVSTDAGTTWKDLICLLSNSVNKTRETTTSPFTKCDVATAAQEITPLGYTWEMPFTALVDTAPSGTQLTYADMNTLFVNGTTVLVRQQYDGTGNEFYEQGSAILTSISSERSAEGFVTYDGTFQGSGPLDITV